MTAGTPAPRRRLVVWYGGAACRLCRDGAMDRVFLGPLTRPARFDLCARCDAAPGAPVPWGSQTPAKDLD